MTKKELIEKLEPFPDDMEVYDYSYMEVEDVKEGVWEHTNYPYDKPDKKIIIIE